MDALSRLGRRRILCAMVAGVGCFWLVFVGNRAGDSASLAVLSDAELSRMMGGACDACQSKINPSEENRWHAECGHDDTEPEPCPGACDPYRCMRCQEQGDFCDGSGDPAHSTPCQTEDVTPITPMCPGLIYTYTTPACTECNQPSTWARWGIGGCNGTICKGQNIKVKCLRSVTTCPSGEDSTSPGTGKPGGFNKQQYCT
jgi:hypothetical protein